MLSFHNIKRYFKLLKFDFVDKTKCRLYQIPRQH